MFNSIRLSCYKFVINKNIRVARNFSSCKNTDFLRDENGRVIVYTDGACLKNGMEDARAGIGVWFNHDHPLNISAPVTCKATSNNAEIQAATAAVHQALGANVKELVIHTDSQFVIKCVTIWMKNWKTNGWISATKKSVKNKSELIKLDSAISQMDLVKWQHIAGHSGTVGNEMANELARKGANSTLENVENVSQVN